MITKVYDFQDANENADIMSKSFKAKSDERNNCQNCCLAYWARMMGMDVTAMPNNPGNVQNLFDLFENSEAKLISKSYNDSPYYYTKADIKNTLFNDVKAAGNGAMFFVVIRAWMNQPESQQQTGHIFIVQNINGKPVCIEPQRQYYSTRQGDGSWLNGRESCWSIKSAQNYFWKMKEKYGIRYLRVDNNKLKVDEHTKTELKNRIIDFKEAEKRKKYLDSRFDSKEVIEK